jgi:hypothetical protein
MKVGRWRSFGLIKVVAVATVVEKGSVGKSAHTADWCFSSIPSPQFLLESRLFFLQLEGPLSSAVADKLVLKLRGYSQNGIYDIFWACYSR